MRSVKFVLIVLAWLVVPTISFAQQTSDWRELNAYTLVVQAYIYTLPWSYMTDQRWFRSADVGHQANQLFHFRELKDASHVDGGSPNNDTLYPRSWLYLKDEPVILSVPAISDRYHSVEFTDYMHDNFAYVSTRATGDGAGISRYRNLCAAAFLNSFLLFLC